MAKENLSNTFNINVLSSFKRLPVSNITIGSMSPDTKNPFLSASDLKNLVASVLEKTSLAETGTLVNNNFGGNITQPPNFEATPNVSPQVETKSETFQAKPEEKPKYNINFLQILPKNNSFINIPADLNNNPNGILETSATFSITKTQKILNNEFSFSAVLVKNGQEKINKIPKSSILEQTDGTGKIKKFSISSNFPILQYGAHSLYFVISSNVDQSKFMSPLVQFSVVVDKLILNTGNIQVISGAFGEGLNIHAEPPTFYTNLMKDSKNNVLFEFLKPFVNINKAVADKNPDLFFKAQPKQIKIYRTTTQPSKLEDIYNDSNLHKTLIVSDGLMFTETLDTDKEYYYMADYKASYNSTKTDPVKPPGEYDWKNIDSTLTPPFSDEEKSRIIKVADTLNTPQNVQDWNTKVISDSASEFNPNINIRLYVGVLYAVDNRNVVDLNFSLDITEVVNTTYGISSVFKIMVGKDNEFYYLDRKVINFEDLKEKKLIKDINSKIFIEPNYSYNFENVKTLGDLFTKSTVFPFLVGNPSFNSKTNFGYYKIRLTSKKTKRKVDINIKNTLLQKFNYLDSIDLLKNKKYNILSSDLNLVINSDLYDYFLTLVTPKTSNATLEDELLNIFKKIYDKKIKYQISNKVIFNFWNNQKSTLDFIKNNDLIVELSEILNFISKQDKKLVDDLNNSFTNLIDFVSNQENILFTSGEQKQLKNLLNQKLGIGSSLSEDYSLSIGIENSDPFVIIKDNNFEDLEKIRLKALYLSLEEISAQSLIKYFEDAGSAYIDKINETKQKIIDLTKFEPLSGKYFGKIVSFYNNVESKIYGKDNTYSGLSEELESVSSKLNQADTQVKSAKQEIKKYITIDTNNTQVKNSQEPLTQQEKEEINIFLQEAIKTFDIGSYSALKIDSTDLLQVIKYYLEKIKQIANFLNKNTKSNISFSYTTPNQLIINNPTVSFISAIENEDKNIADKFNFKINLL